MNRVSLTHDDFIDFNHDMSTGISNRTTKAFGDVQSNSVENLVPMFDGLKLEPSMGGFGALLDMPKEQKSLIDFKL